MCKRRRFFDCFHLTYKPCTNYQEDKWRFGFNKRSYEITEKRMRKMNKKRLKEVKKQQKAYENFSEGF